jgi:hypothetical protein
MNYDEYAIGFVIGTLFVIVIAPDYNGLLRAAVGGLVVLFGEFALERSSKPKKTCVSQKRNDAPKSKRTSLR